MVNRAAEAVKREVFDPMIREDFFEQRHEPLTEGLRKFLCHTIIRQAPVGFRQSAMATFWAQVFRRCFYVFGKAFSSLGLRNRRMEG